MPLDKPRAASPDVIGDAAEIMVNSIRIQSCPTGRSFFLRSCVQDLSYLGGAHTTVEAWCQANDPPCMLLRDRVYIPTAIDLRFVTSMQRPGTRGGAQRVGYVGAVTPQMTTGSRNSKRDFISCSGPLQGSKQCHARSVGYPGEV